MNRIKIMVLLFAIAYVMNACQGNNSDIIDNGTASIPTIADTNTSAQKTTVVLPVSSSVLTKNGEVINIDVRVFDSANNPYSIGSVTKINPSDVLTGRDIGTFDTIVAPLVNGIASFVYTAPKDLTADTSNIVFAFYHDSNATITKTYTMSIVPKVNQTILTNYTLETSSASNVTMQLESNKILSYTVYNANKNQLENASITSIKVTSLNSSLGTLTDTDGNLGSEITIANRNNITLNLISNKKSGLVPLKVEAIFKDANGKTQTLTKVFNVVVLSGPPTAMSLSFAGSVQNASRAKFIESWVLTVTDKYNNLVNSQPSISTGMLAGFATSSAATTNSGNYLYYPPSVGGTLTPATPDTFTAPTAAFSNVDQVNDTLVIFGNGYTYNASGKWDINTNSAALLDLVDDYAGTTTTGLGFAVGNNYRQDRCTEAVEWVGNVYPENNSYILNETGSMVLKVEYDYYLTGKSVMLWINLVGQHNGETVKIGEAKKITLRAEGLTGDTYTFAQGYTGTQRLKVTISNTVEYYKNANFGYSVEVTGDGTVWSVTGTSMGNGITSCVNNGVAYVDVTITASPDTGGDIQLIKLLPTKEF